MSRILLVEDDAQIADLTARKLQRAGFAVEVAADRSDGVQAAIASQPDLILMDVQLISEVQGGLDATRELKGDLRTRDIPIIILSASAMPADRDRAFAAGCQDLEEKPIHEARLMQKIAQLLEARKV